MGAKTKPWLTHICIKKCNWPARALMRERSNRRAELFSLSHSVSAVRSQRLLMSLYCCWISTLSKSVGEMVLMVSAGNSTAALEIQWQINSLLEISVNVRGKGRISITSASVSAHLAAKKYKPYTVYWTRWVNTFNQNKYCINYIFKYDWKQIEKGTAIDISQ